jgi:hypothetical protein
VPAHHYRSFFDYLPKPLCFAAMAIMMEVSEAAAF